MKQTKSRNEPSLDNQDNAILLKIRRQFTSDEAVNALSEMISKLTFEIGVLKSEKEEMLSQLEKVKQELKPKKEPKSCQHFSKVIPKMQDVIYKLSKENEQLRIRVAK